MRTELAKDYVSGSKEPLRFVNVKIMLNDAEDTVFEADSIVSLNITRALTDSSFGIGFTPSDRLSFTAVWSDVYTSKIPKNTRITVYISFDRFVKSSKNWERLGRFYCEECRRDGSLMHVTAFDAMKFQKNKTIKFSGVPSMGLAALEFPCTMQAMLDYIVAYRGLTCEFRCQPFVVQSLPMKSETEYYTVREILGFIASAHGKNARFNYEGKLEFKGFTKISEADMSFSASNVLDQSLDGGEPFEVTGVLFNVGDSTIYIDDAENEYDEEAAGVIKCTNPFASIEIAEYVWSQVGGLAYCGGSMELRGAGIIECGDVIAVSNYKYPDGDIYDMCVTDISYSIDKSGFIEVLSSNVTKSADSSLSDGSSGGSGSGSGVGIYVNDEKNAEAFNLHSIPVEYPDIDGFLGEWGDVPYGDYSHTEGFLSHALGDFAHVEGKKSLAWGENSHAETGGETGVNYFAYPSDILETWDEPIGYTWEEAGKNAHAEGEGWALAPYSHAEAGSEARGFNSHAECGGLTRGANSHASGVGTSAQGYSQTVVGKWNVLLGDDYLFIVGCGSGSGSGRKNALEVDSEGNVHITGALTVDGGIDGTSGGGSYTAGDGINISASNEISAAIDYETIVLDDNNKLKAVGVTIENAIVVQEKDTSYLLNLFSETYYIAGNHIGYQGAQDKIKIQDYIAHLVTVAPGTSNYATEEELPQLQYYSDFYTDGTKTQYYTGSKDPIVINRLYLKHVKSTSTNNTWAIVVVGDDGTETQLFTYADYFNYASVASQFVLLWNEIYPPGYVYEGITYDYGCVHCTLGYKHGATSSTKPYQFSKNSNYHFYIPFNSEAEYNFSIGLAYTNIRLSTTGVGQMEV